MTSESPRFRLIASDVDGTLIDSRKRIPPFTRRELRRVKRDYGVEVILVSTRMPRSLARVQQQLSINSSPFIAYGGALLSYPERSDLSYSITMEDKAVSILLDELRRHPVHVGVFSEDRWFVSDLDYWALREVRGTGVWPQNKALTRAVLDGDIFPVHKVMVRGVAATVERAAQAVESLGLNITTSRDARGTNVEFMHQTTSKGSALQLLLSYMDIPSSSVMAFGDSHNDYTMMKLAGISIAVSNAPEEIRAISDDITLSNDEDGVGYALRKYFPTREGD